MALSKRQRNDLFETLAKKGVDPSDRALDFVGDMILITHLPTESILTLMERAPANGYRMSWVIEDGPRRIGAKYKDWDKVLQHLGYWADEIKYVTETPDLWAELQQVPEIMATAQSAEASNAPFTADEQAEIGHRLDEVKQLVREKFELTDDQLAVIDQRLDDAEEATTRVGRKDWTMMVNGALLGLVVNDLVPAHVVQSVFNVLITGIGHIFGVGGTPPVIGP